MLTPVLLHDLKQTIAQNIAFTVVVTPAPGQSMPGPRSSPGTSSQRSGTLASAAAAAMSPAAAGASSVSAAQPVSADLMADLEALDAMVQQALTTAQLAITQAGVDGN